jgi:hypothetical protein
MFSLCFNKKQIIYNMICFFFVALTMKGLATDGPFESYVRVIRARDVAGDLGLAFETRQDKKNWGAIIAFHPRKKNAGRDFLFEARYYDSRVTVEYFSEGIENVIDTYTNAFVFKRINRIFNGGNILEEWKKRYLFEWKLKTPLWLDDLKEKIESLKCYQTQEFFRYTAAGYCHSEDVDNGVTFCMRLLDKFKIPVFKSKFIKFFLERDYRKTGCLQRQNIFAPYYTSAWPLCICAEISLIQDSLSNAGTRVWEEHLEMFFGKEKWTNEKEKHKDPTLRFIHSML